MKERIVQIKDVLPNSIADELGIKKGDKLISINGAAITDILEYKYLTTDEFLELEIERQDGEVWIFELEKEYDEDIGIVFDGIIDKPKSCHNKCIFCFIDQLPKNMRETLYFKDDDTRLSFIQGNFVSLTNLTPMELNKIIKYRISPINVSVHATDPEIRTKMLNNKNAGRIMEYLRLFKENGIIVKAQIVLCPDVNDADVLDKSIKDLSQLYPELSCVAIVPVGLTKYRDNLYPLKSFTKEQANIVIAQIEAMQKKFLSELGTRFVFLSDEFYIIGDKKLPVYDSYEGFPQLENGVGLVALFNEEIENSISKAQRIDSDNNIRYVIITGKYAEQYLKHASVLIKNRLNIDIDVLAINNNFFGHEVKVSGLITAKDIIEGFKEAYPNNMKETVVFIPDNMLKDGDNIFLDNASLEDVELVLGVKLVVCNQDGSDLVAKIQKIRDK